MGQTGYNEIDLSAVTSVSLASGTRAPTTSDGDETETTGSASKEQKRKQQLVTYLSEDFGAFETIIGDFLDQWQAYLHQAAVSKMTGVPDFVACENCASFQPREDEGDVCTATSVERVEAGEELYLTVDDPEDVPQFCPEDERWISFPTNLVDELPSELVDNIMTGYDEHRAQQREKYKQERESAREEGRYNSWYLEDDLEDMLDTPDEYVKREIERMMGQLFDPPDFETYRRAAIEYAWYYRLDDVLEEEYHYQKAEAFLRAMDSPYSQEANAGKGGDEFETAVREYFSDLGFPLYDRILELEGVSPDFKEMDIHTELPDGRRSIFEVYTSHAHSDKDRQLEQYGELLRQATGDSVTEILFSDSNNDFRITRDVLDVLLTAAAPPTSATPPGEYDRDYHNASEMEIECIAVANSVARDELPFEYTPPEEVQSAERGLCDYLSDHGFDPTLPILAESSSYSEGYTCAGPTITVRSETAEPLTVVFHANRPERRETVIDDNGEEAMQRNGDVHSDARELVSPARSLQELDLWHDTDVSIVEVADIGQCKLSPRLFDRLLRT